MDQISPNPFFGRREVADLRNLPFASFYDLHPPNILERNRATLVFGVFHDATAPRGIPLFLAAAFLSSPAAPSN
ncbi:hypothetical protein L596_027589 [Steinernema carpocapsae]|uniref:Uncharacterized protein n=1 Tax=Steinernema carpocapsae TaxID=34508 RepID=A0A4U5LVW4_STECR|nr:hypothetical protein L596_027589 [Steinernema carpocapsae]